MINRTHLEKRIDTGRGLEKADLVLKGARVLDVFSGTWIKGDVAISDGVVVGIGETYRGKKEINLKGKYLVPGFIDSHVHIESSLMAPSEFEKAVLPRGTTSVIVDPHEIANVMGTRGMDYILKSAEKATLDFFVMLSSCVPATHLETSGATLSTKDLLPYKNHTKVLGLAEMMNYPGLLNKDPEVLDKLVAFQDMHIDGHSPMVRGKDLNAYLSTGVKTCHECISLAEAKEKVERGMQVLLREGSVAKNLTQLAPVLTAYSSPKVSLCTDDRNPLDISEEGHVDHLIRQAIKTKIAPEIVYRSASWSTAQAFGLKNYGAIAPGFFADIVVLNNIKKCDVAMTFKKGVVIRSEKDIPKLSVDAPMENTMNFKPPQPDALEIRGSDGEYRVIGIIPGEIITDDCVESLKSSDGIVQPDLKRDVLRIAVVERYGHGSAPALGFVKGLGLKKGAIGSSVGHDSHNAVVIGHNTKDMAAAFKRLKEIGGGFVVIQDEKVIGELPLPIAGLMTDSPHQKVYGQIKKLRAAARKVGCKIEEPFLQMAFLCLPVIPSLKITDKGLVDVNKFKLVDVVAAR